MTGTSADELRSKDAATPVKASAPPGAENNINPYGEAPVNVTSKGEDKNMNESAVLGAKSDAVDADSSLGLLTSPLHAPTPPPPANMLVVSYRPYTIGHKLCLMVIILLHDTDCGRLTTGSYRWTPLAYATFSRRYSPDSTRTIRRLMPWRESLKRSTLRTRRISHLSKRCPISDHSFCSYLLLCH